jgi:hypothetical protein
MSPRAGGWEGSCSGHAAGVAGLGCDRGLHGGAGVVVAAGHHRRWFELGWGLAFGAGLLGGLVLGWRREAPLPVLGGATVAYVAQAAAVGPIVPAAVVAACYAGATYALDP